MQQTENGGEEEATVDVQFTDLPNALIACKMPEDLFNEGTLKSVRLSRVLFPEHLNQYDLKVPPPPSPLTPTAPSFSTDEANVNAQ